MREWLGGLDLLIQSEGRIWESVRHKRDSGPVDLRRCGVHMPTSYSSRVSISLLVQEEVLRHIPRYHNPKQRSRAPYAPHASTTVTYRILNSNEAKICRRGDTVYTFLYMLAYVGTRPLGTSKRSSSTRQTRAIFSRKRLRPSRKDRLHPDVVI